VGWEMAIRVSVKERHNEHTTSFYSKEGGFCSIRVKDDYICLNWFRGYILQDKHNLLQGNGKVARNQKIYKLDKLTREIIKENINETLIVLFEHNELMKMKSKCDSNDK
jgi:hypothetical protein